MATTVDFVHAYTAVNNSGIILLGQRKRRCRALEKYLEGLKDIVQWMADNAALLSVAVTLLLFFLGSITKLMGI